MDKWMTEQNWWGKAHFFQDGAEFAVCGHRKFIVTRFGVGDVKGETELLVDCVDLEGRELCHLCVYPHEERMAEVERRISEIRRTDLMDKRRDADARKLEANDE